MDSATTKEDSAKINFSFAGCGFLGMYHFGVAACLKHYVPHLLHKISGTSAGALLIWFIVADIPISDGAAMWIQTCLTTREKVIGALSPSSNVAGIVRQHLESCVPPDAHLLVNGKVHISMTRVRDMKNVVISHFDSRAEFIDALICAITIPFFVGLVPPLFRGERYIDGGFSNNVPTLDEHTVTVSPFSGESDICPRDGSGQSWTFMTFNNTSLEISMKNMVRLSHTVIPPGPETLAQLCHQGYDDALRFLVTRDLVGCQACLGSSADKTLIECVTEGGPSVMAEELEIVTKLDQEMTRICQECDEIRKTKQTLPESFQRKFQEAIEADMRSLRAQLKKYKIMKIMEVATFPLALTFDLLYAAVSKVRRLPEFVQPHLTIPVPKSMALLAHLYELLLRPDSIKLPQFWE